MTTERTPAREIAVWLRIGLLSFGGPGAHIALIESEIVERLKWSDRQTFVHGLGFATMLPGPEAMQLGTFLGWTYGGVRGAMVAGLGFIVPGAALMIGLTIALVSFEDAALLEAMLAAVRPVVAVLVAIALWRLFRQVVTTIAGAAVGAAAFAAVLLLDWPFLPILLAAGIAGWIRPNAFTSEGLHDNRTAPPAPAGGVTKIIAIVACGLGLWSVLMAAGWTLLDDAFAAVAAFISLAVIVIFGGAYAVIGYVADQAVGPLGLLTAGQVANGLALSEAAPGPLILFTTYVGTIAASAGGIVDAVIGGTIVTALTFLPSFVMVLAGAPYVTLFGHLERPRGAMAAISACVIGIIANLLLLIGNSAFLRAHALDWEAVAIAIAAALLLLAARIPAPLVVALGLGFGVLRWTAGIP